MSDDCIPSLGITRGCNHDGYPIHNWAMLAINFASVAFLVSSVAWVTVIKQRRISKKLYFRMSVACLGTNLFSGLWCLFREIPGIHPAVVGLMYGISGGVFTLPGVHYALLSYQEIQADESLMMYSGLRRYRKYWIIHSLIGPPVFILSSFLAGLREGDSVIFYGINCYDVFIRILWCTLLIETGIICFPGIYFGVKLISHMIRVEIDSLQTKLMVLALISMVFAGGPLMIVAAVSPALIDNIPALWHIYFGVLESAICAFSVLLGLWMIRVAAPDESLSSSRRSGESISVTSRV